MSDCCCCSCCIYSRVIRVSFWKHFALLCFGLIFWEKSKERRKRGGRNERAERNGRVNLRMSEGKGGKECSEGDWHRVNRRFSFLHRIGIGIFGWKQHNKFSKLSSGFIGFWSEREKQTPNKLKRGQYKKFTRNV